MTVGSGGEALDVTGSLPASRALALRFHPDRSAALGVVAIAASAGGIQALKTLVAALPDGFPLPILICQHVLHSRPSMLPIILAYRTSLQVAAAKEGIRPMPGSIHVAPSNRHMLMRSDGTLGLSDGERVHHCRPAADLLFQSVADVHGAAAIGVVLTGYGQDGAMGSRSIQRAGGFVISQDLHSAEVDEMPMASRDIGGADLVLPLHQIAQALDALARSRLDELEQTLTRPG